MSVYLQMGHQSRNLIEEPDLASYRGAILSPVNSGPDETRQIIAEMRPGCEVIFDPQFYYPTSERGQLRTWPYFSADIDTADLGSLDWWQRPVREVIAAARDVRATAVCSPANVPRTYSDAYFANVVNVGRQLCEAAGPDLVPWQTAVVGLGDLATAGRAHSIASILTRTPCAGIYLIFVGEQEPRRELNDVEALKGAMRLISAIAAAGMKVLVGFSSTDLVLWKAAGAHSVATGKFFNLRRFTSARFDEAQEGGGAVPYWCEEALLAFLRESDVLRVMAQGPLSDSSARNPYAQQILSRPPGAAWIGLGWRQFLWWFADIESRLDSGDIATRTLLQSAEERWTAVEDAGILMEEKRNTGQWLRAWRRALAEYPRF